MRRSRTRATTLGAAASRAARIRGLRKGGQVYLSHATAELIADQLPDGVTLHDVGRFALAGMAREGAGLGAAHRRPRYPSPPPQRSTADDDDLAAPPDDDMARSAGGVSADARDRRAVRRSRGGARRRCARGGRRRTRPTAGTSRCSAATRAWARPASSSSSRASCTTKVAPCSPGGAIRRTSCRTSRSSKRSAGTSAPRRRPRCAPTCCAPVRSSRRLVPDVAGDFPDLPEPVQAEPDTQRYLMFEAVNDLLGTLACIGAGAARARGPALGRPPDARVALASRPQPGSRRGLMVLGTFRADEVAGDHPLRALITELQRDHVVEELELSGLDEDDVGRLCLVACAVLAGCRVRAEHAPRDRGQPVLRP